MLHTLVVAKCARISFPLRLFYFEMFKIYQKTGVLTLPFLSITQLIHGDAYCTKNTSTTARSLTIEKLFTFLTK
jgi:hypothetical protein